MKRYLSAITAAVLCLMKRALFGGLSSEARKLAGDDIIRLSEMGGELTLADFEPFEGENIGSGFYVIMFTIRTLTERAFILTRQTAICTCFPPEHKRACSE